MTAANSAATSGRGPGETRPDNPAEVLREAARLMRERAEAAGDAAPVVLADDEVTWVPQAWYEPHALSSRRVSAVADSEHIASWHPAVALAVADWLDATAERIDMGRAPRDGGRRNHGWRGSREALTVARTYLGSTR